MHDAIVGLDWAQIAITQCAAANDSWNIHEISTALTTALRHNENLKQARKIFHQSMFQQMMFQ